MSFSFPKTWLLIGVIAVAGPALASVQSELAFHRGVVAYNEARYDDARREFESVLREDAEDTTALHYLGLIEQAQQSPERAVEFYRRALAIDDGDVDIRFDLGTAQLEAGDTAAARETFAEVLAAEPDRARAQLFAGISAYRAGAYAEALPHLEHALELDPSLRAQAQYYAGLSSAFLGDTNAATVAFGNVEDAEPQSPLGLSATSLREQLTPEGSRPYALAFTTGLEWDSNPRVVGSAVGGLVQRKPDGRGVYRLRGSYRAWEGERTSFTAGYDGYLSTQFVEQIVDLQTHVLWAYADLDLDPVTLGVRYDFAYTFIDLTEDFRRLYRVTPTVSVREGEWGASQIFYQFQNETFFQRLPAGFQSLNRDGDQNSVGLNQFLSTPEPFSYVRLGALGDFDRTVGSDFDYDGFEVSGGSGIALPYQVDFTLLYRYIYRDYRNPNSLSTPAFTTKRRDRISRLTAELVKPITGHWEVSLGGSFTWNGSNIAAYDYDRFIVGSYATYRF